MNATIYQKTFLHRVFNISFDIYSLIDNDFTAQINHCHLEITKL